MYQIGDTVRIVHTGAVGTVRDVSELACLVYQAQKDTELWWFKEVLSPVVSASKKRDLTAPDYYVSDREHQPYDVINDWGLSFGLGNVVKYISRAGRKTDDPIPDLEKARVYLDMEIARLKEDA